MKIVNSDMGTPLFRYLFFIILSLWSAVPIHAAEFVSIASVLSYGEAYNLRSITLQGTVHDVTPLPPHPTTNRSTGCMIYGAYTFWLTDDTGSLEIEVEGSCYGRIPVMTVREGDLVTVQAQILASDRNGNTRKHVKGEAQAITKR